MHDIGENERVKRQPGWWRDSTLLLSAGVAAGITMVLALQFQRLDAAAPAFASHGTDGALAGVPTLEGPLCSAAAGTGSSGTVRPRH